MEAPRCRTCGERHFSRLCYEPATPAVAQLATKPVAATPAVACPECERLRAEVKQLKQALAAKLVKPLTSTERSRKFRARRKQVV